MNDSFYANEQVLLSSTTGSGAIVLRVVEMKSGRDERRRIDVRRFYRDNEGELRPSKGGVILPLKDAKAIGEILANIPDGDLTFEETARAMQPKRKPSKKKRVLRPKK